MPCEPCPSCLDARREFMREEAVQPLRGGARDALSYRSPQKICQDCQAAENMMKIVHLTWEQARVAVANDRQESLRLPGVALGLIGYGYVRMSQEGESERHHDWLDTVFPERLR
jgi:hypothetical protein